MIRFYDKGSGFDISDDAILKLENGKEFFLDDLKTRKLIGFGGRDMTYEFLDGLEESSGVKLALVELEQVSKIRRLDYPLQNSIKNNFLS